ncbi:hypothetical protein MXB_754 [Myxobolus squamalis]|nr:hypothetical protein MXB_754 [Myxobolus squamalis]
MFLSIIAWTKVNIYICVYILVSLVNLTYSNLPLIHQKLRKKILIYGSFKGVVLLRDFEARLCSYYQPYQIIWGDGIQNFDFDVVVLYFDHHKRFMKEYLKQKPSKKKNMIVISLVPF